MSGLAGAGHDSGMTTTELLDSPRAPRPATHHAAAPLVQPPHDVLSSAAPTAPTVLAGPTVPTAPAPQPFHRLALTRPHRRRWHRPLIALAVTGAAAGVLAAALMVPLLVFSAVTGVTSPMLDSGVLDPHDPLGMLIGLGSIAILIPAVLLGVRVAYGRAGIAHSVRGRFRWGLLGRAALVVMPVYVLVNSVLTLIVERDGIEVPQLTAPVLAAWVIAVLLAPLQCAGEEYLYRVLPLQVFGTWLRSPLVGILLPVPLFMVSHGYDWVGQVSTGVFALVMGLLAWKTGGIEIPILLHVANNLTLFAIAPLLPGSLVQGDVPPIALVVSLAPMLLLSAGIWVWFSRREGLRIWEPLRGTGGAELGGANRGSAGRG